MIAAIIPAFNEAATIREVIEKTKKHVDKVIVVDDGSSDNTFDESKKADLRLRHILNMGKGLALKTGFEAALKLNADIIITLDSDAQHDPEEIPKFLEKIKDHDIIIGTRGLNKKMPIIFRIGNSVIHSIFIVLFNLKIKDTQCGFRAFKSEIYPKIKWMALNYAVETEMLAKAGKNNLKIGEIPIKTIYQDKYKGTTILDGVKIVLNMFKWKLFG